jgi:adenine phosphoribosyltransferase
MNRHDLDRAIRKIPDFPKPGILFYDITGILMNPEVFRSCIEEMTLRAAALKAEAVAAVEARGFLFAAPVAERLGVPLILVRKKGKLPGAVFAKSFALEYGQDTIEIHRADLETPRAVLLIDDLVATGGTLKAAADILREAGSRPVGVLAAVGLPFLRYDRVLQGLSVQTLIDYHGE